LLGRCSTTGAPPPALYFLIYHFSIRREKSNFKAVITGYLHLSDICVGFYNVASGILDLTEGVYSSR
jgi:hypothetical protein